MELINLHGLSATDAARVIREGVISSEQYVAACLARVRETDARIEAWAFLDPDFALAQARAADQHRLSGQAIGPLHGVPLGIKDIIDTADMPTENGSPLHAGRTPSRDAAVVTLLRAAGAVIMGKTITTEFACGASGKTRNPHDPAYSPGGSSRGSAAAVAAGMVPLALGSQTGGSTVRPASYCGVYGLKPTRGLIPRRGMSRVAQTLDTVGLFARTLDDIALLLETCVAYDEGEFESSPRAHAPYRAVAAEEPPIPPSFGFVRRRTGIVSTPTPRRPSPRSSSVSALAWKKSSWRAASSRRGNGTRSSWSRRSPSISHASGTRAARVCRNGCARGSSEGARTRPRATSRRSRRFLGSTTGSASCSSRNTMRCSRLPPPVWRRPAWPPPAIRCSAPCGRCAGCRRSACR